MDSFDLDHANSDGSGSALGTGWPIFVNEHRTRDQKFTEPCNLLTAETFDILMVCALISTLDVSRTSCLAIEYRQSCLQFQREYQVKAAIWLQTNHLQCV